MSSSVPSTSSNEFEKVCKGCECVMPLSEYSVNACMADGHRSKCKECTNRAGRDLRRRSLSNAPGEADDPSVKRPRLTQSLLSDPTVPGEHLYIMAFSTDPEGLLSGLKVGRSGNIARRAHELGNSMPHHMLVLASFLGQGHIEDLVHSMIAGSRNTEGRGREWFHTTLPNILHAVACAMQARPNVNGRAATPRSTQQRLGPSRGGASVAGGEEEEASVYEEGCGGLREGQGFEADFSSRSACTR
jgi:hypothetical protein